MALHLPDWPGSRERYLVVDRFFPRQSAVYRPAAGEPPQHGSRQSDGLPTLSMYWYEAETIRSWAGLDGTPVVANVTVPGGS